jgi:hypothetical protein
VRPIREDRLSFRQIIRARPSLLMNFKAFSIFVLAGLLTNHSSGQESLRISLAGEETAASRRRAFAEQSGNLQLGPASLLLGSVVGLEFNNNVNFSDLNRQQDVIVRPAVTLAGMVPITEANALYATLDFGYGKYLKYSQYDRLTIKPGSQLGLDVYVKDFHFNLHDDLALTEEPIAQGTISGVGDYGEFSNTGGLSVDWDLNEVIASLGFDHQNAVATVSRFSYLDRRSENVFGRVTFQPSDALTAGLETSAGLTAYDKPVLNDNLNYSFGAFADWNASANFRFKPRAGYTAYSFSATGSGPPPREVTGYYLDVVLFHRLNDVLSYNIEAGRQIRLGVNSELIDIWYVRPRIDWHLFEHLTLGTHLTFEQGTDSGNSIFFALESYTLLGGGIGIQYPLMEKVLAALDYDYSVKDSDISARNYHQHRIQFRVQYTF